MSAGVSAWILFGLVAFALALAVQMRIMIGVVVARALRAKMPDLSVAASRRAVVKAADGKPGEAASELEPAIAHIHQAYPEQVRQLRLARGSCRVAPALLILCVAAIRFAS
ncbi:MAG: hypothetical protein AAGJ50_06080 [Pseudomonadota bacterium]